jgi:hypothetical protein
VDIQHRRAAAHPGGAGGGIQGKDALARVQEVPGIAADGKGGESPGLRVGIDLLHQFRCGIAEDQHLAVFVGVRCAQLPEHGNHHVVRAFVDEGDEIYSDDYSFYGITNILSNEYSYKYIKKNAIIYDKGTSSIKDLISTDPEEIKLEYEICKREYFEGNYKNIYSKGEFNNSYCLKNYNATLIGGYKYDKMSYIVIKIYPCVNNSNNNNHCKPQELIDKYLKGGYFSMFSKDIGLNPENFSYPVRNTYQDLYTTIDKSIHRDYIIYYGITNVKTDTGLLFEDLKTNQYLQFRKEVQTFYFRDEEEYYS